MPPQIPSLNRIPTELPPDVLPSGAPRRFLLVSFILFFASLLLYWGLSLGYGSFLERSIRLLEEERDELTGRLSGEDQASLISFYSQANNLRTLLEGHVFAAEIFPILERNTHPRVAYLALDMSVPDREVVLDGAAASYDDLVAQLAIYEAAPEVERLTLESSNLAGSVVNFKIILTLVPGVFQKVGNEKLAPSS